MIALLTGRGHEYTHRLVACRGAQTPTGERASQGNMQHRQYVEQQVHSGTGELPKESVAQLQLCDPHKLI